MKYIYMLANFILYHSEAIRHVLAKRLLLCGVSYLPDHLYDVHLQKRFNVAGRRNPLTQ